MIIDNETDDALDVETLRSNVSTKSKSTRENYHRKYKFISDISPKKSSLSHMIYVNSNLPLPKNPEKFHQILPGKPDFTTVLFVMKMNLIVFVNISVKTLKCGNVIGIMVIYGYDMVSYLISIHILLIKFSPILNL